MPIRLIQDLRDLYCNIVVNDQGRFQDASAVHQFWLKIFIDKSFLQCKITFSCILEATIEQLDCRLIMGKE